MDKSDFSRIKRKMIRLANQVSKNTSKGNKGGLYVVPQPHKICGKCRHMRLRDCAAFA